MDATNLWADLKAAHPIAAKLAVSTSVPVRVSPAFLRLARLRLIPNGSTGIEADLWMSDLVEARSSAGFSFRPDVRNLLREQLAADSVLLERIWPEVHVPQSRWLSPRMLLEEELTWRLLRDSNDPWIETCWQQIWQDLHVDNNAKGIARWIIRAAPNLPNIALENELAQRVRIAAHLLVGDASVLGSEPQRFVETGEFNFAIRRLPKRSIYVGLKRDSVIVSLVRQIKNGHQIEIPATQPLWVQLENPENTPLRVLTLTGDDVAQVELDTREVSLRLINGVTHRLMPENPQSGQRKTPSRLPRVGIEYDIEIGGATRKVELPWVTGVMADLSGASAGNLPELADRNFSEVTAENFNTFMKLQSPRISFTVENKFSRNDNIAVNATLESMDDFEPGGFIYKMNSEIIEITVTENGKGLEQRYLLDQENPHSASFGEWVPSLDTLSLELVASKIEEKARDINLEIVPNLKNKKEHTLKIIRKGTLIRILEARSRLKDLLIRLEDKALPQKNLNQILTDKKEMKTFLDEGIQSSSKVIEFINSLNPRTDETRGELLEAVSSLCEVVIDDFYEKSVMENPEVLAKIETIIARIDRQFSEQLNAILHHPDFQKLEGTWRGLHSLVNNTETSDTLKIKVLNVTRKEIDSQLGNRGQTDWDQTDLFKKIYVSEYASPGGSPFGTIIGDYEFGPGGRDIEVLLGMSKIAAASHTPFLASGSPALFGLESWTEINTPFDIAKIQEKDDFTAWRNLRDQEDSRYIGLTIPRILARIPYGPRTEPFEEFDFEEHTDGSDHRYYTWSSSAYAMGANINRAFLENGWVTRIRGLESGGVVENLPTHILRNSDGEMHVRPGVEVSIPDRKESELAECGLIALNHFKGSDYACFFSSPSLKKPAKYSDPDLTASEELSCRLPHLFAASRFAQYLKCIVRDKAGSIMKPEEMEQWLTNWLSQYVLRGGGDDTLKCKLPLAEAAIKVSSKEDNSGAYKAELFLRPHFQLEGLNAPLRLSLQFNQ